MNHVQIKWKSVAVFVSVIVVIIIVFDYYYNWGATASPYEICSQEVDWSELGDHSDLDYYCNKPHLPVSGSEGVSGSADLRLVSVHVVIRHGDRSPLHELPNVVNKPFKCQLNSEHSDTNSSLPEFLRRMQRLGDRRHNGSYVGYSLYPTEDHCGSGSLTPTGVQQHILNGEFLREAYITKHKLLVPDDNGFEEQMLTRGTDKTRTFQSAVAFMHGFAPEVDVSRIPALEMASNNTLCIKQTGHQCACAVIKSGLLNTFSVTAGLQSSTIRNRPAVHRIAERLGVGVDRLPRLTHVFDVVMTHYCHGMAAGCFGSLFVRDVYDIISEAGRLAVSGEAYRRIARLKIQPLLYEIAHRMNQQLHSPNALLPKFVLYSGHDSSVEPLAAAVGVSNGNWPKYASRLVFELYAPTKEAGSGMEASIRVLHDGKDVTRQLSFCKDVIFSVAHSVCPLKAFFEFVNDKEFSGGPGENGYNEACKNHIS